METDIPQKNNEIQKKEQVECCPLCFSTDIETVNAGTIGGEVFITLRCRKCGNEDTLDEYQLSSWYR